jgi:N-acetylglucosaminyl-diphospho-decaprenol L-rhamnosyltransferase
VSDVPRTTRVACVVVDYLAGSHLHAAVASLIAEHADELVVVDNAGGGASRSALGELAGSVVLVEPARNLGFGGGANRGLAAVTDCDVVVVANADVIAHAGVLAELAGALAEHRSWAIVGPTILNEQGLRYPSVRRFPSMLDAVGHATLGRIWPANPFTVRYRESGAHDDGTADWVSGSFFAARREVLERLGGFDERYFMFAEDMDLCWRARREGFEVGTAPRAVVTHVEGVSRRVAPRRMLLAHHVSALRFAARTTEGPKRLLLPIAALVLTVRLGAMLALPTRVQAKLRGGR